MFENLRCTREGLSSEDANRRLQIFGPNKLEEKEVKFFDCILFSNLKNSAFSFLFFFWYLLCLIIVFIFSCKYNEKLQESKFLKFLGFMWNPLSWVMEAAAIMAIALANGGVSSCHTLS